MKTLRLPFVLALLSPVAFAQEGQPTMPNPNDAAYAPFKSFVGTWDLAVKMMEPGQAATETTGTETFELVCNGLFLKSVVNATYMGKPFQGVSLWSYDAKAKNYVTLWVDSENTIAVKSACTFDAASKTWNAKTVSGPGPSRGVMVWKDDNTLTDTSYMTGPDGKEAVAMEIVRKRSKSSSKPATAVASTPLTEVKAQAEKTVSVAASVPSPGHAELHRCVGKWNTTMRMPGPDGKVEETPGTEVSSAVCNGLFVWTDFHGTMMGQPFEGHGLVGYDPATKTYTNYWVDSMSPFLTELTGTYDSKTKTLSASGKSMDPMGNAMPMTENITWKDDHNRVANFTFGSGAETQKFEILYKRAQQEGAYKIK